MTIKTAKSVIENKFLQSASRANYFAMQLNARNDTAVPEGNPGVEELVEINADPVRAKAQKEAEEEVARKQKFYAQCKASGGWACGLRRIFN